MQNWLKWANELIAIAQNGLTFSQNSYDINRYERLQIIASEILSSYTTVPPDLILNLVNQEKGYHTPKLDVRGAVFRDNKILLVKENADQCWSLPGGWADVNESAKTAVEREIAEEAGYLCKATKLIALFDKQHAAHNHPPEYPHAYKAFFLCDVLGQTDFKTNETSNPTFYSLEALPRLSTNRVTQEQIRVLFRHYHQPNLPTEFD